MRKLSSLITGTALTLTVGVLGCVDVDPGDPFESLTSVGNDGTTGDGDGDGDSAGDGDGDGDPSTGDGDGDGDGDGECGGFNQACCVTDPLCDDGLACNADGICDLGGGDGDGDSGDFPDIGANNSCPETYFPDMNSGKCLPACDPQDPADMTACPAGSMCAVAVYGYEITAETCATADDCVNGLQGDCLNVGGMVCVYFQKECADDAECASLQGTNPNEPPGCWPLQSGSSCATLHCTFPG